MRCVEKCPMDDNATVLAQKTLSCQECRRPWLEPRERWRVYLADDESPQGVPYCPDCATREFDGE